MFVEVLVNNAFENLEHMNNVAVLSFPSLFYETNIKRFEINESPKLYKSALS